MQGVGRMCFHLRWKTGSGYFAAGAGHNGVGTFRGLVSISGPKSGVKGCSEGLGSGRDRAVTETTARGIHATDLVTVR